MRLIFTSILFLIAFTSFSQTARDYVRSGNEAYKIDSVNQAVLDYEKALELDPLLEVAKFNMGDAYFKSEKFADAAKAFNQLATTTKNTKLKADAFFNEGDAQMQSQKFEEAMGAFKNSLRADPTNNKARYNYEYAKKMLAEQQKQEQEKKDNEDNKDDKEDDKKDKDDKDKDDQDKKDDKGDEDKDKDGKDDKDKKDQDKDKDKDKKDGDQDKEDEKDKGDEEKDKGNPDENKGDQDQQKKEPQPQPGQMSKADAERLLKAMEDNEKKTRDKVAKMKAKSTKKKKSDKDW